MKKFFMMFLALFTVIAANAWTVKFTNPNNWAEVAAYTFDGAGKVLGEWPGTQMTKGADGVYTITSTAGEPKFIIFNNNKATGASQTGNLIFEDGTTYDLNGPVGAKLNSYSVYFDNSISNWAKVYCYTFEPELFGGWAGKELTKNSDGLYVATIEATSEPSMRGIIFSNGTGGQKGVDQTEDLKWETGATYNVKGKVNGNGGGEEPVTPPTPGTYEWVNIGSDNWNTGNNDYWKGIELKGATSATWENLNLGNAEFAIKTWNGTVDGFLYAKNIQIGVATALQAATSQTASTIAGATADDVFNVTIDLDNTTITVTKVGGDEPITPPTPVETKITHVNIGSDNWAPAEYWNGKGVSENYTVTWSDLNLGNAEFAIKTWDGATDGFLYATNITIGTATALIAATSQTPSTIAGAAADDSFNVVIDLNNNTITVTKVGGGDDPVTPPAPTGYLYLDLGCDNWNTGNDDYWKGVAVEGSTVSWTNLNIGNAEFAIKTWDGTNNGYLYATDIEAGVATALKAAETQTPSNIANAAADDVYDVTINLDNSTITVTKVGGGNEPVNPPTPGMPTLYLRGAVNNWGTTNQMSYSDGVYTITLPTLSGNFKIADADWSENNYTSGDTSMELGESYQCFADEGDTPMSLAGAGATNVTVTFVYDTKMLTITGTPITEEVITWAIHTNLGSKSESDWTDYDFEGTNLTTSIQAFQANAEFIIKKNVNGVTTEYWKTSDSAANLADLDKNASVNITMVNNDSLNDGALTTAGNGDAYKFAFKPETGVLTITRMTTSVDGIYMEGEEDAVYFNLQGVKVANPTSGIYVRVSEGKAAKVTIK